jgi:hypothetical protein
MGRDEKFYIVCSVTVDSHEQKQQHMNRKRKHVGKVEPHALIKYKIMEHITVCACVCVHACACVCEVP